MSSDHLGRTSPHSEHSATRCPNSALIKSRRRFLRFGAAGLTGAALFTTGIPGHALVRDASSAKSTRRAVENAAAEYAVPTALLLAMGYVNTRLEMPPPQASDYREGDPAGRGAYGIMALVRNPFSDTLGEASRLTGIPVERLKEDRKANIMGGAALLASSQGSDRPVDVSRWMGAVHGKGGHGSPYTAPAGVGSGELYAGQVDDALTRGFSVRITSGELISLAGRSGNR